MRATYIILLFALVGAVNCSANVPNPIARPHIRILSPAMGPPVEASNTNNRVRTPVLQPLTPTQLRAIYNIPNNMSNGAGKTIAVINAYGASSAESDLAVYNAQYGLPACTTANGMFIKVNQTGGNIYPPDDTTTNWGFEVALDTQSVHAIAPGAKILLVVAKSANMGDLLAGVNYAKTHADYISMSFGAPDGTYAPSYDSTYFSSSPKVPFFASTGDNGAANGVEYPSTSAFVVAVGGTSVYTDSTFALVSEEGWTGSGGGCSVAVTAPSSQSSNAGYASLGCIGKRAVPDVAMVANPSSGLIIYYTRGGCTLPQCYYSAGGTSLSSPLFAARAAIRGATANVTYVYGNHITYRDITTGTNGNFSCKTGLDLVTGQGTWIGAV